MEAVVFGATPSARNLYQEIEKRYTIVCFCDNDKSKWGRQLDNVPIVNPERLLTMQYDEVIIINKIPPKKIDTKGVATEEVATKKVLLNKLLTTQLLNEPE